MRRPRSRLRAAGLVAGGLAVVGVAAIALSALLDWPAKSAHSEIEIVAPRERVWSLLTDLSTYDEWNPVVTRADGTLVVGRSVKLQVQQPGGDEDTSDVTVLILNPRRKFRWQDRLLVPGLRDREYEVRVIPAGEGRFRVIQHERVEGLAALFTNIEPIDEGLDLIAEALKQRAEEAS